MGTGATVGPLALHMSARLDTVLQVATVADVLRLARFEPPARERDLILCPLPQHVERTPSFMVQRSNRGYRCHGCGAHGGVLELVVALGLARDRRAAVDVLADQYRVPEDTEGKAAWKAARQLERQRAAAAALNSPAPREPVVTPEDRAALRKALGAVAPLAGSFGEAYLRSRGIEPAAAYDTRFHGNWLGRGAAVVLAVRDHAGRVVAAQGRMIEAITGPKAMSRGRVGLGVYATAAALAPMTEVVAIVEGPIDALSLAVCELPAIALCGAKSRPAWLRTALAFRSVVLATDNDTAGDASAEDLRVWLNLGTRCSRLALPARCKDTNELLRRDPDAMLDVARAARRAAQPDYYDLADALSAS